MAIAPRARQGRRKRSIRTRTYSKTKYIASFVGFAPVNDPAITIAVIIDSPTVGSHFGHAVSAPVFQELAQEILEYLGVPHDQPIKPPKLIAEQKKNAHEDVDGDHEQIGDLDAMFAEVNHLPKDDPLRAPPAKAQATTADADEARAYLQNASDPASSMQPRRWSGRNSRRHPVPMRRKHHLRVARVFRGAATPVFCRWKSRGHAGIGRACDYAGVYWQADARCRGDGCQPGIKRPRLWQRRGFRAGSRCGHKVPAGTTIVVRFHP